MKIDNFAELDVSPERAAVLNIIEAGIAAIDTSDVIKKSISIQGDDVIVGGKKFSLPKHGRLIVIAVGKCALNAAVEIEKLFGDRISSGVVLDVREDGACNFKNLICIKGSHPMPDETNVHASRQILSALRDLTADDLVIFLISGGGSTLLCLPLEGGTCLEEKLIVEELFRSGATIQELNTVRKHMSLVRGGNLAKAAYPARAVSLIFSDVPGNDPGFIASGPTVKDTTTVVDAENILAKYDVLNHCKLAHCGLVETPKEDKYFENVYNMIVISNEVALEAMSVKAAELGFVPKIASVRIQGEASDVGRKIAEEIKSEPAGTVLLYGGETTVTVATDAKHTGRGGRNQELALSALEILPEGSVLAAFASDGRDNGPYAGALADRLVAERAKREGISSGQFLDSHNSSEFYERTGGLLKTANTGSNVSDLMVALKAK